MFQHTAARRRLVIHIMQPNLKQVLFQHTAARRRLASCCATKARCKKVLFQHTAARRRLTPSPTPSYPTYGFNTQPPEGGCYAGSKASSLKWVSTHSRPKAAEFSHRRGFVVKQFQHTAARRRLGLVVGFAPRKSWFQHTAARRRLPQVLFFQTKRNRFQHTAARRRLDGYDLSEEQKAVSTHSRPKAAATVHGVKNVQISFNTQPPEGGCTSTFLSLYGLNGFNTQPPEGGW